MTRVVIQGSEDGIGGRVVDRESHGIPAHGFLNRRTIGEAGESAAQPGRRMHQGQ